MSEEFTQLCKDLEHFETPEWAARAILKKEILSPRVFDPCCGAGILSELARAYGKQVMAMDIHNWGYSGQTASGDFLDPFFLRSNSLPGEFRINSFDIFMNPPFSKAVQFVEKSLQLGARKIVCFQRFAWWESQERREFWTNNPPNRVYICGDRANCWRHDIPLDQRGSSSPTAHAWFVWQEDSPPGTKLGHIYKSDAS